MSKKTMLLIGAATVGVASLGTAAAATTFGGNKDPASEQQVERQYTEAHRSQVGISEAKAEHLAQLARPGAVVESHLQSEGQGLRWEVKTRDANRTWEIQLDPGSGTIVANALDE